MVKLKRLKIERYRNVKPGTELHFRDSFNVLLGKNGTGKTTLLELIARLLRWDFSQFQHEPCDVEYEVVSPESRVVVRLRAEQPPREQRPDERFLPHRRVGLKDRGGLPYESGAPAASVDIVFESLDTGARHLLQIKGSSMSLHTDRGGSLSDLRFESPLLTQDAFTNIFHNLSMHGNISNQVMLANTNTMELLDSALGLQRFDESLSFFEHIPKISTMVLFTSEGNAVSGPSETPQELAYNLEKTLGTHGNVDEVRLDSKREPPGFLRRVVTLLEFESAELRLRCLRRDTQPIRMARFGDAWFSFQRKDGSTINHTLLSYGQKRLLAFYYYLACNPHIVVADELVNGMHHEWIEACFEDMGQRQAFLTSQNPLLLDYLWFESAEEVHSSFVLCRTELKEGSEQLVWENMSRPEAEGFFNAYQVKIQHVGELLRTRGLW